MRFEVMRGRVYITLSFVCQGMSLSGHEFARVWIYQDMGLPGHGLLTSESHNMVEFFLLGGFIREMR